MPLRPARAALAGPTPATPQAAVPDRAGRPVRRLLCQCRTRLFPRSRVGISRPHSRSVRGVPVQDVGTDDSLRPGSARGPGVSRPRQHGRRREGVHASTGDAGRAVHRRRTRGGAGLLPVRRGRPGETAGRHGGRDRLAAGVIAGPLHGGRGPHGMDRRPHRHGRPDRRSRTDGKRCSRG